MSTATFQSSVVANATHAKGSLAHKVAQFEYKSSGTAQQVVVTGEFDNWSQSIEMKKEEDGSTFTARVPLAASVQPGDKIMFKFVVDGVWKTSPSNPIQDDGNGNENNVFIFPHLATEPVAIATTTPSAAPVVVSSPAPAAASAAETGPVVPTAAETKEIISEKKETIKKEAAIEKDVKTSATSVSKPAESQKVVEVQKVDVRKQPVEDKKPVQVNLVPKEVTAATAVVAEKIEGTQTVTSNQKSTPASALANTAATLNAPSDAIESKQAAATIVKESLARKVSGAFKKDNTSTRSEESFELDRRSDTPKPVTPTIQDNSSIASAEKKTSPSLAQKVSGVFNKKPEKETAAAEAAPTAASGSAKTGGFFGKKKNNKKR
ncbi:hypothetical protein BDR26DRAFT_861850 [Obelidium mucronatum]|nr:hypothetical protein BDR26DRAFT_861850 [Obelidium mucronatum]